MSARLVFYKAYLVGMLVVSVAGFVAGYAYGPDLLRMFIEQKSALVELLKGNPFIAALAIFGNNVVASLIALVPLLGLLVLGANMAIIGSLASLHPLLLVFLVPHGVFELPAVYYSVYLGARIVADSAEYGWKRAIVLGFKSWLKVTVPLLFIAAFVEVFVSAQLAKYAAGAGG